MKTNVMGLLGEAARQLRYTDGGRAYALYELANNLRLVILGEATLEEFKAAYVVTPGREPFDIDKLLPVKD